MADREKVILALKIHAEGCGYRSHHCDAMECPYRYGDESCDIEEMCRDALELLKEQEEKPLRCKTCTMRDRTGFCHRWNREVKDDDYCSFGAWKGC